MVMVRRTYIGAVTGNQVEQVADQSEPELLETALFGVTEPVTKINEEVLTF